MYHTSVGLIIDYEANISCHILKEYMVEDYEMEETIEEEDMVEEDIVEEYIVEEDMVEKDIISNCRIKRCRRICSKLSRRRSRRRVGIARAVGLTA